MQCNINSRFNIKNIEKKKTGIRKNIYFFIIITTLNNKIKSEFLTIHNIIYNILYIFLNIHFISS